MPSPYPRYLGGALGPGTLDMGSRGYPRTWYGRSLLTRARARSGHWLRSRTKRRVVIPGIRVSGVPGGHIRALYGAHMEGVGTSKCMHYACAYMHTLHLVYRDMHVMY